MSQWWVQFEVQCSMFIQMWSAKDSTRIAKSLLGWSDFLLQMQKVACCSGSNLGCPLAAVTEPLNTKPRDFDFKLESSTLLLYYYYTFYIFYFILFYTLNFKLYTFMNFYTNTILYVYCILYCTILYTLCFILYTIYYYTFINFTQAVTNRSRCDCVADGISFGF